MAKDKSENPVEEPFDEIQVEGTGALRPFEGNENNGEQPLEAGVGYPGGS